jgi:hypothetical protein
MPADEYPLDEFLRDFEALNSRPCPNGDKAMQILAYLDATYGTPSKVSHRGALQMIVGGYLVKHAETFDQGEMAVIDPAGGLISLDLLKAAHALLWPVACDPAHEVPAPEELVKLADSYASE